MHPNSRAHHFFSGGGHQQPPLPFDDRPAMPKSTSSGSARNRHTSNGSGGVKNYEHQNHQHQHQHQHQYEYDHCAGAEPGVNPRSGLSVAEYSHFKQDCVIDVIDYDADDVNFQRLTNAGLLQLLNEPTPKTRRGDDELPPRMVRWINIGGIDWGVLRALALKYNLHSLALEDILHERGHNHSKADYYPGHLFIRVLCHTVHDDEPWSLGRSSASEASSKEDSLSEVPNGLNRPDLEEGGSCSIDVKINPEELAEGNGSTQNLKVNAKGKDRKRDKMPSSTFGLRKRISTLSGFRGPDREKQLMQIFALTKNERVFIKHEPMFIFLLRDGTVISMRASPDLDYTSPIHERLHRPDSVLRTSEDASLLVESFLDLIVDRVVEMVDEYQVKITKLEHDILLNPDMDCVRSLHILSGDLIMHKRTLEPIKSMIFGLRRYDLDRCMALADTMAMDTSYASDTETESTLNDPSPTSTPPNGDEHAEEVKKAEGRDSKSKARRRRRRQRAQERLMNAANSRVESRAFVNGGDSGSMSSVDDREADRQVKRDQARSAKRQHRTARSTKKRQIEGFFSYQAKVYMADVYDHIDFALTSLDMFSGISENLINYAFNMASYEMNTVMKRLTLVTIIFLPLTLLTGYFGMNFTPFWSVDKNSDAFFWKIAAPVMAFIIPLFMFEEIKKFVRYSQRRWQVRAATKGIA